MTYGIEWNSKPSTSEEVKKKDIDIEKTSDGDSVELLDLPAEILVIILQKVGYDELRSLEMSCTYLR